MRSWLAPVLLMVLGLAQMAGDLVGWAGLQGMASATTASPAPRVFSAVDGFETYSTEFFLSWRDGAGSERRIRLESERYGRLGGPYNRRNAYGAVVAFAPVLASREATRPLFEAVARHALCGDAPLLRELEIGPVEPGSLRLRLVPRDGTQAQLPMLFSLDCDS